MSLRRIVAALGALLLLVGACSEESPAVDYLESATTTAAGAVDTGAAIAAGASAFAGSCSACHGPEALGVDGLGKNLVGTEFITGQSVEDVVTFIGVGRPSDDPANTTGIAMLPKGGNPSLTDADLNNIVLWLKSLAGDVPAAAPAGDPAAIEAGASAFAGSCSACHGPEALGVDGLGKNLVGTDFIQAQSAEELVAFISVGRPSDDPANTTGIAMLPKGGNPSLSDTDLANIVAWLKSLS